ncbi:3'-5' exoribonuclease YhaM family protein [candidate division KSB1 bacterium]
MKSIYVSDLDPGGSAEGFFVLRRLELAESGGTQRLVLELGDKTGRIGGVMWQGFHDAVRALQVGDPVKIRANVGTYQGKLQLTVDRIRKAEGAEIDASDFLAVSPRDKQEMIDELKALISTITDVHLNKLLEGFVAGPLFDDFCLAPAGKLWHHAYLSGLLEHTLSVIRLCDFAAGNYPEVDRDLLLLGAVFHDVGKVRELCWTTFIDYTDDGRLVGHLVMGERILTDLIAAIPDFPDHRAMELRHLLLSHHGEKERGSPIPAQTLEAMILSGIDDLDARANAILRIESTEKQPGTKWSKWVNLIERFIYFGQDD